MSCGKGGRRDDPHNEGRKWPRIHEHK
jgi:hypothetical protein